ncbi:MAG TPA: hypothetical protein VIR98_03280 [Candidatus Paceibacterota bacterium]|jgi:hypothetical protein
MQAQTQRYHSQRIERKTEKVTSHAAGAVIVRVGRDGIVEFLLVPYTMKRLERSDETTLRCIVETQLDYASGMEPESPTDTLERGIREEVMKDTAAEPQWNFWPKKPIVLARLGSCERRGGRHLKLFRMIVLENGVLRTDPLVENGSWNGAPTEEVIGAPQWIEAAEAIERMRRSKQIHFDSVTAALWKLVNENPDYPLVAQRYGDLIDRLFGSRQPIRVYDHDFDAVVSYIKSFKN